MRILPFLVTFLFLSVCLAQPEIVWNRTYDCDLGALEYVVPSGDGGFVAASHVYPPGRQPGSLNLGYVHLLRIDGSGDRIWNKTYELDAKNRRPECHHNFGLKGLVRSGNGFIVVCFEGVWKWDDQIQAYWDAGGYVFVFKVDDEGEKVWERTYNLSELREIGAVTTSRATF